VGRPVLRRRWRSRPSHAPPHHARVRDESLTFASSIMFPPEQRWIGPTRDRTTSKAHSLRPGCTGPVCSRFAARASQALGQNSRTVREVRLQPRGGIPRGIAPRPLLPEPVTVGAQCLALCPRELLGLRGTSPGGGTIPDNGRDDVSLPHGTGVATPAVPVVQRRRPAGRSSSAVAHDDAPRQSGPWLPPPLGKQTMPPAEGRVLVDTEHCRCGADGKPAVNAPQEPARDGPVRGGNGGMRWSGRGASG